MEKRDIVVIGASAGGVEALSKLVASLPAGFNGAVFIVLHISPFSRSQLPQILSRCGLLEAVHPKDGEHIVPGRIYIAPPDHHMLLEKDKVLVKKGPKENRFRPAVDALFRSAAYVYGPRVIGVVLTGVLNDGTSGLWSVKRMGGMCIIQEPEDADFPDMPVNAMEYVQVDHVVPVSAMGELIGRLTESNAPDVQEITAEEMKMLSMEVIIATHDNAFEMGIMSMGKLTPFTCPECHGALVNLKEGKIVRYRCHTGHAYTASALLTGITETIEETLWQSMRALEEGTMLLNQMKDHFETAGNAEAAGIFLKKAKEMAQSARVIHDSIFRQNQTSEDARHK